MSDNIDWNAFELNRTLHAFFEEIQSNPFSYSNRFRQLVETPGSVKSFYYDAKISNVSSPTILCNENVELTLNFHIADRSFPWLTVKKSTIPGAGNGVFLAQPGNQGQLVTSFMGYKKNETK